MYSTGYLPTSCLLILLKQFLIFGVPQQLSEINNPTVHLANNVILSPVDSAHNHGVIFDLSFAQHITAVSKSYFHNIRDPRRIRNTIDQTAACRPTIATSLIHSKRVLLLTYKSLQNGQTSYLRSFLSLP